MYVDFEKQFFFEKGCNLIISSSGFIRIIIIEGWGEKEFKNQNLVSNMNSWGLYEKLGNL